MASLFLWQATKLLRVQILENLSSNNINGKEGLDSLPFLLQIKPHYSSQSLISCPTSWGQWKESWYNWCF